MWARSMLEIVGEAYANQALADLSRQNVGLAQPYPRIGRAYGRLQRPSGQGDGQGTGSMVEPLKMEQRIASDIAESVTSATRLE